MRSFIVAAAFLTSLSMNYAVAETSSQAAVTYSTADTDIGTLLDDPGARAIIDKHVPGFSTGPQIDMARSMTLRGIQPFASDTLTDTVLNAIDADLAELSAKKK